MGGAWTDLCGTANEIQFLPPERTFSTTKYTRVATLHTYLGLYNSNHLQPGYILVLIQCASSSPPLDARGGQIWCTQFCCQHHSCSPQDAASSCHELFSLACIWLQSIWHLVCPTLLHTFQDPTELWVCAGCGCKHLVPGLAMTGIGKPVTRRGLPLHILILMAPTTVHLH